MTSSRFETYTFVELSRLNLKRGGGGLSEGTPPLISGFLLPRRGGEGLSVEEFQTGGICVFDDGLTRLVLLVIGDLNPRSERKREGLITEGNEIDWYINLSL